MRSLSFVACLFLVLASSAQQPTARDGGPVLPQKGEHSLGFDLTRMIRFNGLTTASLAPAFTAKYMVDSATAYRADIMIGVVSLTTRQRSVNRAAALSNTAVTHPAALPMNDNVWIHNGFSVGLGLGIEKRRGSRRLQSIYGISGRLLIERSSDKFTYANALNASPTAPIDVDTSDAMRSTYLGDAYNVNTNPPIVGVKGWSRVVERKNGMAVGVGVRVFAGAEYFFLPKISLGAELGWGLSYVTTGRSETVYESVGQGTGGLGVRRSTIDGNVTQLFSAMHDEGMGLAGPSGSLRLNVYF